MVICQTCWRKVHKDPCPSCSTRKWRENNPVRYCYQTLKDNSKGRGIKFDLTFEEFEQFCIKTDYLAGKGKTKTSYSIDRIESNKGYTKGNIQVLSLSENSSKGKKQIYYNEESRSLKVRTIKKREPEYDDPF